MANDSEYDEDFCDCGNCGGTGSVTLRKIKKPKIGEYILVTKYGDKDPTFSMSHFERTLPEFKKLVNEFEEECYAITKMQEVTKNETR